MANTIYRFTSEENVTESGGAVSAWADTVEGYTISQTTEADKPIYTASAHKGHPSLKGDGISKHLVNLSGRKLINSSNFPSGIVHVHMVLKCNALSNLGRPYSTGFYTPGYIGLLLDVISNGMRSSVNKSGASYRNWRDSATDVLTAGDLLTISQQYELGTTNHELALNGSDVISAVGTNDAVPDLGTEDSLCLFAVTNTATTVTNHSNIELFEWFIADGSIDAATQHAASMAYWDVEVGGGSSDFGSTVPRIINPILNRIRPEIRTT